MDVTMDMDLLLADVTADMQRDGIDQSVCSKVAEYIRKAVSPINEQIKKLKRKNEEQEMIISEQKDTISQKDEAISNLSEAVKNLSNNQPSHPPCMEGGDPTTELETENQYDECDYGYRMPQELTNDIFFGKIDGKDLDLEALWRWIARNFVKQLKYKYDWFALWKILVEKGFIRGRKQDSIDFEFQMRKWFPDIKKPCRADAMNCYRYPYLGENDSADWNEADFLKYKRDKQRKNGFTRLKKRCDAMRSLLNKHELLKGK